jgi:hypothetical protein
MKKFITKVQDVRQKAAEIASVIESAPARAAELREAVLATAGQMHQMRRTVQDAAQGLVANDEGRLIAALHEIDERAETFRAAGYELENVEMELAAPQRLIVHLEKVADVSFSTLRSLADANEDHPTTHAILTALLKAEDMSDKVTLQHLQYHQLTVYMGPVPTVRLCWCAPYATPAAPPPIPTPHAAPVVTASAPASAPAGSSFGTLLGQSSFFEARPAAAPRTVVTPASPEIVVSASSAVVAHAPSAAQTSTAKEDPLARFKKMPDLSRKH